MPMPPLRIQPHLSYKKLTTKYRTCKNTIEKSRWHLIWLMSNPQNPLLVTQAANTVGFCERWARQLVNRYNVEGSQGLADKRRGNQGQEPVLDDKQKQKLSYALTKEQPNDKGLWTSPKVADWIEQATGTRPTNQTGLNYLHELGFTLQQPRPTNIKTATELEIKSFKKN